MPPSRGMHQPGGHPMTPNQGLRAPVPHQYMSAQVPPKHLPATLPPATNHSHPGSPALHAPVIDRQDEFLGQLGKRCPECSEMSQGYKMEVVSYRGRCSRLESYSKMTSR